MRTVSEVKCHTILFSLLLGDSEILKIFDNTGRILIRQRLSEDDVVDVFGRGLT